MAHVKVVRRSMSVDEWINLRFSWLSRHIIKQSVEIEGWQIREARQVSESEYEFYDEEYRPFTKGDQYFTPDGTSFLKVSAKIPDELRNSEVWLQLRTAAEMIVKVNEKWAGGIDPNRSRMLLSSYANEDGTVNIEIEGYNRSKPDDDRNPQASALKGCRQTFTGGQFVIINAEIEAAIFDVQILMEAKDTAGINEDIRDLIKNGLDIALNLIDFDEEDSEIFLDSVKQLRCHLQEKVFSIQNPGYGKVALVSHSHLDIAYYWRSIHAIQKNARTCLIQLRLMQQYPEFKYCHTQAYLYETLEKYYPEIFEELKERIAEGRFELAGAMYVEPDCNVPTAESIVRQCMYGQHYYREKFNKTVENCWLPDVFGNSWILPQILQKSGVKYFVSNKMSTWNDTNRFPHNHFIWKGIDGTEVYACVPPTHFITWNTPNQIIENWNQLQDKDACKETLNMFGYGDGGSGATDQMLEYARRINNIPGMPQVRHIRGDEFLKDNLEGNEKLQVWDGELYLEMHRGTFTSKGELKKRNRELELTLRNAELLCTMAAVSGFSYPTEELKWAWKKLLVNQFHDILTGSHIAPVTRDTLNDYAEISEKIDELITKSATALKIYSESNTNRYNLVNTFAWERKGLTFIEGNYDGLKLKGFASQMSEFKGEKGVWAEIDSIKPTASKLVEFVKDEPKQEKWFTFENLCLETDYYKVQFDPDGSISSLFDKIHVHEAVQTGKKMNHLKIYKDNPGSYDAWDILPNYKDREDKYKVSKPLEMVNFGEVLVQFEVQYSLKKSVWTQKITFFRRDSRIDFDHKVDWHERNRLAKMEFNINVLTRTAKCDTSAGTIIRDTHVNTSWQKARFEVCSHKWVDISENGFGIAIMNDSKYGLSLEKSSVGLTLLRAPIRPDPYSDEGTHIFSYSVIPHNGSIEQEGIIEKAWMYNSPVCVFPANNEISDSFITISVDNIHLQSVKMPEYPNGKNEIIVRVIELKGKHGKADLIFDRQIKSSSKADLLEDVIETVETSSNKLSFEYKPFEINTFKVEL